MTGFLDRLKPLLGKKPVPADDMPHFIYVYLPEALEPDEREARYGDPLNAELQLARLGEVSGGGSLLGVPDEDGSRAIIYSGVDVDAADLGEARALLRRHLHGLGCPAGTRLEFQDAGVHWKDEYDGAEWHLRQPPTPRLGE